MKKEYSNSTLKSKIVKISAGRLLPIVVLAVVWAVEIFLTQEYVYRPDFVVYSSSLVKQSIVRLTLDLLWSIGFVAILPRFAIFLLFVLTYIFGLIQIVHYEYFNAPLSFITLTSQTGEGLAVFETFSALLSPFALCVLTVMLVVKCVLLRQHNRRVKTHAWRFGIITLFCAVSLNVFLLGFYRPVKLGVKNETYYGHIYGFVTVGIFELAYYGDDKVLSLAQDATALRSSRLDNIANELGGFPHLVVVQAESLDYDAVFARSGGTQVMPFLFSKSRTGVMQAIKAVHPTGSADSDFVVLMSHMPNSIVPPYSVADFSYDESLPFYAEKYGWQTEIFHGNRGSFFARERAFRQMGFSEIFFQRRIVDGTVQAGKWGVSDGDVFDLSSKRLLEAENPSIHFIITMTTHSPFNYLPEDIPQLISAPVTLGDRYINSMRYLDDCLCEYFEKLPDGTIMIIYGDHSSRVTYGQPAADHADEKVPFIVLQARKGETNVGVRDNPYFEYSTLDVASFIRKLISNQ